MDVYKGGNLQHKIDSEQQFTRKQVKQIIQQLALGLNHMHSLGFMHRDIKPDNILFKEKQGNSLVIADFGLSTKIKQDKYIFTRCGTAGYVAPEIFDVKDGNTYKEVCDVFSLGIILHILLLGYGPFDDETYEKTLKNNQVGYINFNEEQYTSLKPDEFDLIVKLLQPNPENRISLEEVLEHQYLQGLERRLTLVRSRNSSVSSQNSRRFSNINSGDIIQHSYIPNKVLKYKQKNKIKKESLLEQKINLSAQKNSNESLSPIKKGSITNRRMTYVKDSVNNFFLFPRKEQNIYMNIISTHQAEIGGFQSSNSLTNIENISSRESSPSNQVSQQPTKRRMSNFSKDIVQNRSDNMRLKSIQLQQEDLKTIIPMYTSGQQQVNKYKQALMQSAMKSMQPSTTNQDQIDNQVNIVNSKSQYQNQQNTITSSSEDSDSDSSSQSFNNIQQQITSLYDLDTGMEFSQINSRIQYVCASRRVKKKEDIDNYFQKNITLKNII